jgi:hypothetical protein
MACASFLPLPRRERAGVHAQDVAEDLGLDRTQIIELKLAGNQDETLYRELLIGQCHQLHKAMPFLFEALDDETELLLPDNLTRTDSILRGLVDDIPEEEWQQIEIIGWLYQFYISEKKDQVIGKVVKSEDIPAATQLFTPNWIVKYMVQNSLGAQWLETYPQSSIKSQMDYYIEPAEQTDEVKAQLVAITPSQLNPEELTLIDPASGSGHILVEAYELFKAIYLDRGYRQRDVAKLILEKNLFGLDIDGRAAQLTGFALMMKGRADDRRLFERGVKLNVMALVDSTGFDAEGLAKGVELGGYGLKPGDLTELQRLFEHATTFGSLIQVPEGLAAKLPALKQLNEATSQDLFVADALKCLGPLVQQAEMLAVQYDAVVANPPYMGSKFYCAGLKKFVNSAYKAGKTDLYGAFTLRNIQLSKDSGIVGMITIPNWMFLSSFEQFRDAIFQYAPISSLVHNGRGVWGSDFGSCSYILRRSSPSGFRGRFLRLFDKQGSVASNEELERRFHRNPRFSTSNAEFSKIPESPVAYWVSQQVREAFQGLPQLGEIASPRQGLSTTDNNRFCRYWQEVSICDVGLGLTSRERASQSGCRWFPLDKGGGYRKWFGNNRDIVNWQDDGRDIKNSIVTRYPYLNGNPDFVAKNPNYYFTPGITWGKVTIGAFSIRKDTAGFIPSDAGMKLYADSDELENLLLSLLNSCVAKQLLASLSQTINFEQGTIKRIPVCNRTDLNGLATKELVIISKSDWDAYETSWEFQSFPILTASLEDSTTLESSYTVWTTQNRETIAEMKRLEEENNRLFIDAYGLAEELTPDVPLEQITLTVNPAYRYGGKLTVEEQWTRFRQDTMAELVSYAIGCMMGRYSLDKQGLIYANSGNEGFDPSRYASFPADDDGIIPLTDTEWFEDDAANRLVKFISIAWDKAHLEENLTFLAGNLFPKKNESSHETIRRYLCTKFFKDHLKTYKKRPIYWLFSSGKQKAFECLVYLHRYNESTLARMRTEYVTPLTGKFATYAEQLENQIENAPSTAETNRLKKELTVLEKKLVELREFDAKLKHFADRRINLDLDDGVKVNYGKFGDLLAEVKAITGKKPEVE